MDETTDSPVNGLTTGRLAEPRIEFTQRREARLVETARQMQRFRTFGILRLAVLCVSQDLG